MSNALRKLAKELRSFAKRNKNIKYTEGLLIAFLLMGTLGLAATDTTDKAIAAQKNTINTTVSDLKSLFSKTKAENEKLLKGSTLELIQLMEQGDHVVKSPWSSWQFGINTFINDWNGTYKGRGDKQKDVIYERESSFSRYKYSSNPTLKYGGTTELSMVTEPNAEIPISASLNPFLPPIKNASIPLNVNISSLPTFNPRVVQEPITPTVLAPNPEININLNITSGSRGSGETVAILPANGDGVIQGVALKSGKIIATASGNSYDARNISYTGTDLLFSQIRSGTVSSQLPQPVSGSYYNTLINVPTTLQTTKSDAVFHVSGYSFGVTLNGADIDYTSTNATDNDRYAELVHQDVHGGSSKSVVNKAITDGAVSGITTADFDEITKINAFATQTTVADNYNLFGNSGNIVMSGERAIFSNSYNHGGRNGVILNSGNITLNKMLSGTETNHAIFLVSGDTNNNDSQQHFYNTGVITTNTDNTAIAVFSPDKKRNISFINKGSVVINGDSSVGVYTSSATGANVHLSFSDATNTGTQNQITTHTESSNNNKYINGLSDGIVDKTTAQNNSKTIVINGKKSAGLYMPNKNSFVNGQFAVDIQTAASDNSEGSVGIYSNSDIDLQGHYVKVGGTYNVGVYPSGDTSTAIYLGAGSVELDGGSDNAGIVVKSGKGRVFSESEMVLKGGIRNTAIYADGHIGSSYDVTVKSIETDTTPQEDSVFIYAENGAKVKTDEANGGLKIQGVISSGDPVYTVSTKSIDKTVGAAYATGSGTLIDISQTGLNFGNTGTNDYNIEITGAQAVDTSGNSTGVYTGFGLFADNGAEIRANYNKIKTTETGAGIASIGTNSKVILDNGELYYDGPGYALYSKDDGQISLQNGKLVLDGSATGFSVIPGTSSINLTGTDVQVVSDDVILMSLKDATGVNALNTLNLQNQLLGFTGLTSTSLANSTSTGYKIAVVDGSYVNVNSNIDKSDTTSGSDSEVFTRRLLLQNSIINVNSGQTVTANLDTTEITSIDPNSLVPVGLAISASENSANNTTTQIINNGTVEADRTDTGNGAIGLYVHYGQINNTLTGTVNVETGTTNGPNSNAVGIFGINNTPITNDGTVTVGGDNSIGILGLSYRLDSTGNVIDPSSESFYQLVNSTNGEYGKVNVANNGTVTMNNDAALGLYVKNNSLSATNVAYRKTNANILATNNGVITMNGSNNAIGMGADNGILTNGVNGVININGTVSAGMYGENTSILNNDGTINVVTTPVGSESIGMFTTDASTAINTSGTINVGDNSYGIFGKNVRMTAGTINVGDNGVGIYSSGPNVNLASGTITVADNNAVGVYIADDTSNPLATTVTGNVNMTVGDNSSFGYLITTALAKTDLTTGAGTTATVGEKSAYIYSSSPSSLGGKIINNTAISTKKNNGYGIYSSQDVENHGNIDLTSGVGNIGIYSTGGTVKSYGIINVGATNSAADEYGIGIATGYYDKNTGTTKYEGVIENHGTINVNKDGGIGMYAAGSNSIARNYGTISLTGKDSKGMYIDQNAVGENHGTIIASGSNSGIMGVVTTNGGYIKNYGTIDIRTPDGIGIYQDPVSAATNKNVPLASGAASVKDANAKSVNGVYTTAATDSKPVVSTNGNTLLVQSPPKTPAVSLNGVAIPLTGVDTNNASPNATQIVVTDPTTATTTLDFSKLGLDTATTTASANSVGMYVDTSGINHTNPIQGLNNLIGLNRIDLIFGTEATEYTNSKAIEVGSNILDSYNNAISGITGTGTMLDVNSSSLTWVAHPVQGTTNPIAKLYLVKIPYTFFASSSDPDTYNFLDGLEQRYDQNGLDSREKTLFNKLNNLGKGETHIFTQAVNEMKGYQYSNVQHRINATGNLLDKEFSHLYNEWETKSKESNKVKIFGMRDEYSTDTAGIYDYTSDAYGIAYLHEDETVKLGDTTGWYAGAINNRFEFADLGGSKENQTMLKAGIFKSKAFDDNNSLNWTIAGELFGGINEMKRKYWIVDEVFGAESNYYSYGVGLKNQVSKSFRTSAKTSIKPYAALDMEYGRMSKIEEKTGEVRLEIDANDYYSIKPEVGLEFKYFTPLAKRTKLITTLGVAYENELGQLKDVNNKARVGYTTANWYNLRDEKDDRKGNFKTNLNLGIENQRVGFTLNLGYDTKGENFRGGIGIRAIY